jgi:hypothetical protein
MNSSMTDQKYAFRDMLGILLCADRDTLQAGQGPGRSSPPHAGGHKDLSRKYVNLSASSGGATDPPQGGGQATDSPL